MFSDYSANELKKILSLKKTKFDAFILQPFCLETRMEKNASKFPLKSIPLIPRFKFDLRPEKIEIEFSKNQLTQISFLAKEWARFDRARQHRKWRPVFTIKQNPRSWWKFIINRIIDSNKKKCFFKNKTALLTRIHYFNAYCKAYKKRLESLFKNAKLLNSKNINQILYTASQNQESVAFMRQVEHDAQFTYNELYLFRETVYKRYFYELNLNKKNNTKNKEELNNVKDSTNIKTELQEKDELTSLQSTNNINNNNNNNNGKWYNWFSSWFSNNESTDEKQLIDDVNEAYFLDLRPKLEEKEKNLPAELRAIEKQIEEEILDVLNETWDDSTILRRDTLLAELVFRLDKLVVRFVDNEDDENLMFEKCNRVLSLDMRRVVSRMHLSPREHRTEISLNVEDMSVQRMQIIPSESMSNLNSKSKKNEENQNNLNNANLQTFETSESLLYGEKSLNTRLIFTIGKVEENEELKTKNENNFKKSKYFVKENKVQMSILQLFYKRLAPKLDVYHELNIQLAPIYSMYDEDALKGLLDLFDNETSSTFTKFETNETEVKNHEISHNIKNQEINSKLFLTLSVPQIMLELRRKEFSMLCYENKVENVFNSLTQQSLPFSKIVLTNLKLNMFNSEPYLSKIKLKFQSIIMHDLFEQNCEDWPLIKSVSLNFSEEKKLKNYRSFSCPNLMSTNNEQKTALFSSTSLPDRLNFDTTIRLEKDKRNANFNKIFDYDPLTTNLNFNEDCKIINFILVDERHPRFETEFKKQHCTIQADLKNDLDIGMNQRSWTTLLEFFGLLEQKSLKNYSQNSKKKNENLSISYVIKCKIKVDTANIKMNFPKNKSQLGNCLIENCEFHLKFDLNNFLTPLTIQITSNGVVFTDKTTFYSQLYNERLIIKNKNQNNKHDKTFAKCSIGNGIFFKLIKYRLNDPELNREADLEIYFNVSSKYLSSYVHTNRYFFSFIEFWLNFVELQNCVFKKNEPLLNSPIINTNQQKTRCKLNINLKNGLALIIPLNQHREEAIIYSTNSLKIKNFFKKLSEIETYKKHFIDRSKSVDGYNCLINVIRVSYEIIKICCVYRVDTNLIKSKKMSKDFKWYSGFSDYSFCEFPQISVVSNMHVEFNVYENLSCYISHCVPDFAVIINFGFAKFVLTSQFCCLLRGVIEQNLSEQYVTIPENIPFELLELSNHINKIDENSQYATFCFRLIVEDLQYDFYTPLMSEKYYQIKHDDLQYKHFALIKLQNAKISFDNFIDGRFELYLICESINIFGCPFISLKNFNGCTNIMTSRNQKEQNLSNKELMCEAHILYKKNESPIVTLVLHNARVFFIFDWFLTAKNFLFQTTEFVLPVEGAVFNYLYEVAKEGILIRSILSANSSTYYDTKCLKHEGSTSKSSKQTFTLKITLKEIDLIFFENANNINSQMLIFFITGIFSANDVLGFSTGNFQIQKISLSLTRMSEKNEFTDVKLLTNEFSATISLIYDIPLIKKNQSLTSFTNNLENLKDQTNNLSVAKGIHLLNVFNHRQKLFLEFDNNIEIKFSLKEFYIVKNVLLHYFKKFTNDNELDEMERLKRKISQTSFNQQQNLNTQSAFSISKILIKWNWLDICILNDTLVSMPFIRIIISKFFLEKSIDRLTINTILDVKYFNETTFGYDWFVEAWNIEKMSIQWRENFVNVNIVPHEDSILNINLTQTFLKQIKKHINNISLSNTTNDYKTTNDISLTNLSINFNIALIIPAGIGISLINNEKEELIYVLFRGVKIFLLKKDNNYQLNGQINLVQADNQLLTAEKWQFFYCEPKLIVLDDLSCNSATSSNFKSIESNSLIKKNRIDLIPSENYLTKQHKKNSALLSTNSTLNTLPALTIEISYSPTSHIDVFENVKISLQDLSILLDEMLLWKAIKFLTELVTSDNVINEKMLKKSKSSLEETFELSNFAESSKKNNFANDGNSKKCFFENLSIEIGNVSLSATAVSDNLLSPNLKALKKQYKIILVSFENAPVSISKFSKTRYYCLYEMLFKTLKDFYLSELKKQKLSIAVTMDAFGNPMGLATDFKDSFEGLIFDGDVGGFVFGLGYGVTNSISKVASSMAQGVGFLTFDEHHEQMRQKMLRNKIQQENSSALSHLYGGVKGFGVGVFGGLTAIAKNTYTATQKEGVYGLIRGVTTGAVDTVTKPLQGALDLLEGTALAFKEVVGTPLIKKSQFAENRLRLPRVCTNLQSCLLPYSYELAEAQQMLLRINSFSTKEHLFDVVKYLEQNIKGDNIKFIAMITSEQCYIMKKINNESFVVTQRIFYKFLRNIQPAKYSLTVPHQIVPLDVTFTTEQTFKNKALKREQLWCMNEKVASQLSKTIMNAKNYYDRANLKRNIKESIDVASEHSKTNIKKIDRF